MINMFIKTKSFWFAWNYCICLFSSFRGFCKFGRFRLLNLCIPLLQFFPLFSTYFTWLWRQSSCQFILLWLTKKSSENYLREENQCICPLIVWSSWNIFFSGYQKLNFDFRKNERWKPYAIYIELWSKIYWRQKILSDQCAEHDDATQLY